MNTIRPLFLSLLFLNLSSASAEPCASIEILNETCNVASVKADLSKCEDILLGVIKIKCKSDQVIVSLRGKNNDYRYTIDRTKLAWGNVASGDVISSELKFPHRSSVKTMPETKHERPAPVEAAIVVPVVSENKNEQKISSAFMFSGYLDGYLEHNFNRPRPLGAGTNPQNNLRFYDFYSDQFNLNLAEFTIKHVRKETSFIIDLDFGQYADANALTATATASGGPTLGAANEMTKHIGQAVLTYTPSHAPGWIFEIGKMPTHVGLELMKAKDNWNYTRSTLFSFGGPFWHTGIHAGYSLVPGQFTVNGYAYNGWGTVNDANFAPTFGSQLKWTPNDRVTWIYNYIGGSEQNITVDQLKQIHETNVSYNLTPTVSIATDFLYGTEKGVAANSRTARWFGAQFGMKWQTSPTYYLSPRFEIYRDYHGYTLGGAENQSLYTYTLTQSYLLSEGFELRVEGRLDHSNLSNRFITREGTSDNQATLLLGILYTM